MNKGICKFRPHSAVVTAKRRKPQARSTISSGHALASVLFLPPSMIGRASNLRHATGYPKMEPCDFLPTSLALQIRPAHKGHLQVTT